MSELMRIVRPGLVSLVVLTASIAGAGAAYADSAQDQFVALLEQEQVPPTDDGEVPALVGRAHQICRELDGGMPTDALVDDQMNRAYADNWRLRLIPDRVRRTAIRFITASVSVYCPGRRGDLPPYE